MTTSRSARGCSRSRQGARRLAVGSAQRLAAIARRRGSARHVLRGVAGGPALEEEAPQRFRSSVGKPRSSTSAPGTSIRPTCRAAGGLLGEGANGCGGECGCAGRCQRALYERLRTQPIRRRLRRWRRFQDWRLLSSSPERLVRVERPRASRRGRSPARGRAAAQAAAERARDRRADRAPEGARRARHADRPGAQRSGPRLPCRAACARMSSCARRAIRTCTTSSRMSVASCIAGLTTGRCAARGVSRRHHHGLSQIPLHADHRRARARGTPGLHRRLGYINRDGSMDFNILIRT